jgi:ankyrin repeat protein
LLEAGADPNDGRFWHGLPTPFTVLTGVLGSGEGDQPPHPHAISFARLLLASGADPNDGQALYNRMFASNDDHLVLLFDYGLGRETRGPWRRLLGESLESPTEMLRSLLAWVVTHDQRQRVALLAEHGVDIVSRFTEQRSPRGHTPVEMALINGHRELADQLLALGAQPPSSVRPTPSSPPCSPATLTQHGELRHRCSPPSENANRIGHLGRSVGPTQRRRTACRRRLRHQRTRP